ncbi:MAG: hypothetical protein AAB320_05525 [Elusimicrobiota bacterium]
MRPLLSALALLLGACIPYPGDAPPVEYSGGMRSITEGPFPLLDAGASELDTLHFKVKAYGTPKAIAIGDAAEADYNRIMVDTGLYSFKPRGLYQLIVYANAEEYHRKTAQPAWSGGLSIGNAIYTYEGPGLRGTLSHEMTHLIFYEFMAHMNADHRWVNEGLAVFEQNKALAGPAGQADIFASVRGNMRQLPIPMDQMIRLVPATEREYAVSVWYAQAESMIRFMIERGGRIGFSQFLTALRSGKSFDAAVNESFPGIWRGLAEFESAWKRAQ